MLFAPLVDAQPASAGVAVVRVDDIDFRPRTLRVPKRARVTWRFQDRYVTHNVRSTGRPRFRSSPDRQAGTHTVRFRRTGTYRYVCTLHYGMRARVVVRAR